MAQSTPAVPSAGDVEAMVQGQRREWEKMRDELRPAVDAFQRIEALIANFDNINSTGQATGQRRRSGSRGTRMQEFVALAGRENGITPTEAAREMEGIDPDKPNYLYSLAKKALDGGLVRKDGKRYFAVTQDAAADDKKGSKKNDKKDEAEAKAA